MRERCRHKLNGPICLFPGDKLVCTVNAQDKGKSYRFEEEIEREVIVDTLVTFDVDTPILGLSDGIGAIFGKAE